MIHVTFSQNCVTSQNILSITFNLSLHINLKRRKMKKKLFIAFVMIFALSASTFASELKTTSENNAVPAKTENKLSAEEVSRLTKRVEEIRDMDKSNMTVKEKRELRKELKTTKENVRKDGGYLYISAGTVILIIILIILLV